MQRRGCVMCGLECVEVVRIAISNRLTARPCAWLVHAGSLRSFCCRSESWLTQAHTHDTCQQQSSAWEASLLSRPALGSLLYRFGSWLMMWCGRSTALGTQRMLTWTSRWGVAVE